MNDSPGPRKGAGLNELRLDAMGTRDDVAATFDAIEGKVDGIIRFTLGVALAGMIGYGIMKFRAARVRPATGRPAAGSRIRAIAREESKRHG